ncbi:MAG: hypothetical protein ACRDK2_14005 [Solirubrobacteraceae bacterium]
MNTATPSNTRSISLARIRSLRIVALLVLALTCGACLAPVAVAVAAPPLASVSESSSATTLESAASKAGSTGRKVAMSLIGLAFAIAAIVLAFRRDFKEAAGVLAIGVVAVFLATSHGVSVLENTVNTLFT